MVCGAWRRVPREAPGQLLCPATPATDRGSDGALREHRIDLGWAMRLSEPACQAMDYPDGTDRPGLGCPLRPVRRISWSTGARPASRRREWSRQGCHRHFPDMVTDVDAMLRSERDDRFGDPSWPGR